MRKIIVYSRLHSVKLTSAESMVSNPGFSSNIQSSSCKGSIFTLVYVYITSCYPIIVCVCVYPALNWFHFLVYVAALTGNS